MEYALLRSSIPQIGIDGDGTVTMYVADITVHQPMSWFRTTTIVLFYQARYQNSNLLLF